MLSESDILMLKSRVTPHGKTSREYSQRRTKEFSDTIKEIVDRCFVPPTEEEMRAEQIREQAARAKSLYESLEARGARLTHQDMVLVVQGTYDRSGAVLGALKWKADCAASAEAPRILVLSGEPGSGKTFAAGVLLASAVRGVSVESERLHCRTDPWQGELRPKETRIDTTMRGLIVLDDLGTETDFAGRWERALFNLIDSRLAGPRYTLITTNLKPKEFPARYDPRVVDRLNANARVVVLEDGSKRKVAKRG